MLCEVVLGFESEDEILLCEYSYVFNAIKHYFLAVLFIMLYKRVLTFESVDEFLECDHSNEVYWAVIISYGDIFSIAYKMTFRNFFLFILELSFK